MPIGEVTQRGTSTSGPAGNPNIQYRGIEWQPEFRPDFLIYVFNISQRTFHDPNNAARGVIGRVALLAPGVAAGDPTEVTVDGKIVPGDPHHPYHYVTSFPHPIMLPVFNDQTGEIETKRQDGRRFVVDMISPDNVTLTLDAVVDANKAFSQGNDYAPKGIFFSYSNPPAKEDVEKAYGRMEAYYRGLNEAANTLQMSNPLALQEAIRSNPDYVFAATYYGKDFAWAREQTRPVNCLNCGEKKQPSQLFHKTSLGTICVEPTVEAWRAAVNSGNKEKAQVPDDYKWWARQSNALIEPKESKKD